VESEAKTAGCASERYDSGGAASVQPHTQVLTQAPGGTVLRLVENRRVMTVEEAEKKMDDIVGDLFGV
jgi:hypothetical protein